jgi:hypothetical protein
VIDCRFKPIEKWPSKPTPENSHSYSHFEAGLPTRWISSPSSSGSTAAWVGLSSAGIIKIWPKWRLALPLDKGWDYITMMSFAFANKKAEAEALLRKQEELT